MLRLPPFCPYQRRQRDIFLTPTLEFKLTTQLAGMPLVKLKLNRFYHASMIFARAIHSSSNLYYNKQSTAVLPYQAASKCKPKSYHLPAFIPPKPCPCTHSAPQLRSDQVDTAQTQGHPPVPTAKTQKLANARTILLKPTTP